MAHDRLTLRHNEELHNNTLECMIEGKKRKGRSRISYISQLINNARVDSNKQLKDKPHARDSWREYLL